MVSPGGGNHIDIFEAGVIPAKAGIHVCFYSGPRADSVATSFVPLYTSGDAK
jgi:hypothetical protein